MKPLVFLLLFFGLVAAAAGTIPSTFSLGTLNGLPAEKQPRRIEDMIGSLPEELRSNFTIMRKSRSLQEKERVIMFSQTANTIVTFNGHAGLKGGKALEVMRFLENPARFELREIEFDPKGKLPPKISPPNPQKCLRCHGADPQPIWGDYDANDGVYAPGLDGIRSNKDEKDFFALKKRAQTDPRLQKLVWKKEKPYFPFFKAVKDQKIDINEAPNLRLVSMLSTNVAIKAAEKVEKDPFLFSLMAANVCTFSLADESYVKKLSAIIDARIGNQAKHYARLADAKEYSAREKGEEPREVDSKDEFYFFSDSARAAMGLDAHALSLDMERGYENKRSQSGFFASTVSLWLSRLLYQKRDMDSELQALAEKNPKRFRDIFKSVLDSADKQYLQKLVDSGVFNHEPMDPLPVSLCPLMKKYMRQELDAVSDQKMACLEGEAKPSNDQPLVNLISELKGALGEPSWEEFQRVVKKNNCDQCHSVPGVEIGPSVPFLDRFAMKGFLKKNPGFLKKIEHRTDPKFDPKRRMPLAGDALSVEDRTILLEYLRSQK